MLINSPCAEVSDIGQRTGTDFGNVNGIASFDANGSDFPFTTGIVLMSGDVSLAPGPNTSLDLSTGDGSWPGDADLEANTTANNTNNASAIQFNFVPQIDQINFNFICTAKLLTFLNEGRIYFICTSKFLTFLDGGGMLDLFYLYCKIPKII